MPVNKARHLPFAERVDPAATALLVIDVQNNFCHPQGYHGRAGADLSMMPAMAERVAALVAAARRAGTFIIWVRATYDLVHQGAALAEQLSKGGRDPVRCAEGSWEAAWLEPLAPNPEAANEVVVTKHRYSAFWDTEIDLYLRSNGIGSVVLAGVVTSGCVDSTARDAFFRNYRVVLAEDACADNARSRHEASLGKLSMTVGMACRADEVIAAWDAAPPGRRGWHAEAKQALALTSLDAMVDPRHAALVVIDMQNDFCHPDGLMARRGEDVSHNATIVPVIASLLAAARQAGAMVVHAHGQYGLASGSPASLFGADGPRVAMDICLPGSWGAQSLDELAPAAGEPVVVKHRLSAFIDTGLDQLLRANGLRSLVVVGTATQACVESTVRDARFHDYHVVVAEDAVGARGRHRAMHEASLEVMRTYFAEVVPAARILDRWRGAR
jgi:nicotinamidase-related amidase